MDWKSQTDKILAAIQNFPTPTDITGARSWFGLINQVSWVYAISPTMQPFRDLIKPSVKFYWDETFDTVFHTSKQQIIQSVREGVQSFDFSRKTCLQTDWCQDGIGYLSLQQHCHCTSINIPTCCSTGWKLINTGSRFTTSSESRYSPSEGRALTVSWALQHSRMFTLGSANLVVSVDHKPLLGIFNNRELNSIKNPRQQNFKESCVPWTFEIMYNPGKWHRGPDAMSRNPSSVKKEPLPGIYQVILNHTDTIPHADPDPRFQSATLSHLEDVSHSVFTWDHIQTSALLLEKTQIIPN